MASFLLWDPGDFLTYLRSHSSLMTHLEWKPVSQHIEDWDTLCFSGTDGRPCHFWKEFEMHVEWASRAKMWSFWKMRYPSRTPMMWSLCFWCWLKEMGEESRKDHPAGQSSQKEQPKLNLEGQQRETQSPKENWKEAKGRRKAGRKHHGRNLTKEGLPLWNHLKDRVQNKRKRVFLWTWHKNPSCSWTLSSDRAEGDDGGRQGRSDEKVNLAEVITSRSLAVKGRTETGLYPGGIQGWAKCSLREKHSVAFF